VLSSLILNGELDEIGGGREVEDKGRGRGGRGVTSTVSTGLLSIITEGTYNPARSVRRLLIRLFTALITNNSILSLFSPSVVDVYIPFTAISLTVDDFPLFTEDTAMER
jgi:hypothetical protein